MTEKSDRIDAIIAEHLACEADRVVPEANLIDDLGADSLDVVELTMAFEEEFRVEIPDDLTEGVCTVDDWHKLIDKLTATNAQ